MIAFNPVGGAAARVADQTLAHGVFLDPGMEFKRWVERFLGRPVGDQFDTPEKPAAADVADMGVIAQALQ